jgi:hypothetical protein
MPLLAKRKVLHILRFLFLGAKARDFTSATAV